MPPITLSINRKSGKYEGRGAVPFSNKATVLTRQLCDAARPGEEIPLKDPLFRRFIVHFASGHRYVADLGQTYFEHHQLDIQDAQAIEKFLEAHLNNAEVFRRCIRDFSKQIPVVYEFGAFGAKGQPLLVGHMAPAKRESAWETRIIPEGVL
ncbi:MAG: hypothetical protein U0931_11085 [Vulcanimicrobiota bacterium]